jgi:hypothetical protein
MKTGDVVRVQWGGGIVEGKLIKESPNYVNLALEGGDVWIEKDRIVEEPAPSGLDWSHLGEQAAIGLRDVEQIAACLAEGDEMDRLSGEVLAGLLSSVQRVSLWAAERAKARAAQG